MTATDPETAERLALRLSPGTTWVSHLLQRLAHGVLAGLGWHVRTGEEFLLDPGLEPSHHLRVTVHDLTAAEAERFAADLEAVLRAERVGPNGM